MNKPAAIQALFAALDFAAAGPYCHWRARHVFANILYMEFRIRRADLQDVDHILRHRRAMFEEIGNCDVAMLDRVERISREYLLQALRDETYMGWLAEDRESGKVVGGGGIVLAHWPGYPGETLARRAWILNMYTEPEARRKGTARELMNVMIEWCRRNGFGIVSLHASAAGRPLYEKLGFRATNEMALRLR